MDPERALALLRFGLGAIWLANLAFVLLPANQFFPSFAATVGGLQGTSVAGFGLPAFVAAYPVPFSFLVAGITVYLAVAFLGGISVRAACVIGAVFSGALLLAQWATTFAIPGGTDVGPHPIYLAAYLALGLAPSERYYSLAHLRRLYRSRGVGGSAARPAGIDAAPPSLSPR